MIKIEETVPFNMCAQQILNDLHEMFYVEEKIEMGKIEKIILKNMDSHFSRTRIAALSGLCVRTIRNKLNERI